MTQSGEKFESWLKKRLDNYNIDEEVLVPYIKGILDSDESEEEQHEALDGILASFIEGNLQCLCTQIFDTWKTLKRKEELEAAQAVIPVDVDKKLSELMHGSRITVAPIKSTKKLTSEQKKLKQTILSQYSQVSDGDESGGETECAASGTAADSMMSKNTNAEDVARAEREQRDKDKEDSHKKKEKDKEDRSKQKTQNEDRKDKEKKRTQKGEKRR